MDNKAMFTLGYGLYVLTARNGDKDNGCIINTLMQITDTPARIVVGVNCLNETCDMIHKTGVFNASVLTESAPFDLFRRFGFQSGRDVDKFADYTAKERAANGVLYVTEASNAYLSCKVISETDLGTHKLYVADVTDAVVLSQAPSCTYAYYHKAIKPQPGKPASPSPAHTAPVSAPAAASIQTPSASGKKRWRCRICGYIYEGEELPPDFICPICKHGAADFELIEE